MIGFLAAVLLLLAGGGAAGLVGGAGAAVGADSAASNGRARWAARLGAAGALAGGALGAALALLTLFGRGGDRIAVSCGRLGCVAAGIDHLAALFLLPVFLGTALVAIYGLGASPERRGAHGGGATWLAYDVLCAFAAGVLLARSLVPLLVAWEGMALAAAWLAALPGAARGRRRGAFWLLALQLGAAALGGLALMVRGQAIPFGFRPPEGPGAAAPAAGAFFLLALVGFGAPALLAAGHAPSPTDEGEAAPAHVRAGLAVVLVPSGTYAFFCSLLLLPVPGWWWGVAAAGCGSALALAGVWRARGARSLDRLVAGAGTEHVGWVLAATGLGLLGVAAHFPTLAFLAFAAAFVQALGAALFLPLLALAAGAIGLAGGSLSLDRLGGLASRARDTTSATLAGGLAAAAQPPLNGLPGLLLLAAAGVAALGSGASGLMLAGALMLAVLALAVVLAGGAWLRALAAVFTGDPRTSEAAAAHEVPLPLRLPMHLFTALCVALGLFPTLTLLAAARPAIALAARAGVGLADAVDEGLRLMGWAGDAALVVLLLTAALAASRWARGRRGPRPAAAAGASPGADAP